MASLQRLSLPKHLCHLSHLPMPKTFPTYQQGHNSCHTSSPTPNPSHSSEYSIPPSYPPDSIRSGWFGGWSWRRLVRGGGT
ncbi:hypothetical protein QJS04_geneDACA023343 [Acorus gramineus]|uniref:Uncharacterized protein n=1 Tax=Acorus gramineus TaxID=55184 RepID=A0AAV9A6T4_ACOGR|nr:hypothetical protein QJS04_geneDACA023343 [Acorus gramineus]